MNPTLTKNYSAGAAISPASRKLCRIIFISLK